MPIVETRPTSVNEIGRPVDDLSMHYYCAGCEVLDTSDGEPECWSCGSPDVQERVEPAGPDHAVAMAAAIALAIRARGRDVHRDPARGDLASQ